ncbi:MAG: hypothetical protein COU11_03215 [Candidatus Harrisonbacteria bacterium CG10_big_fil_rev_8_21_14_0_10_49_15]|uniref:UDP-N-acetylmuramoyl-L-alanyl-D-glutamate--2, 6-diaminopimelate ligase n=1 Tax=Candidatus Harrisonbacteria bacterium CG10_big_fil_rev_8_21_14_0_10_49_15 TaxID=1974587 RepID=A0A2H0UKB7_9BACT|nr:MAG: hypothetical protein COU11_03215 [Candidatus Harrisonbacteria bacterium CG10_big_fil_rev_8_21_14_0_10_49_15]
MIVALKNSYHWLLARISAIFYGFPSRKLIVIGVTGTKGKTTSVELIAALLRTGGERVAFLSSANMDSGNGVSPRTGNTMPGRFAIARFLRRAVTSGCKYAVLEVTSQGVLQHRHEWIEFDAAVFTNLHPEHVEAHGSFEAYRAAKVSFFEYVAGGFANNESATANQRMAEFGFLRFVDSLFYSIFGHTKKEKKFFINSASEHGRYFAEAIGDYKVSWYDRKWLVHDFLKNEIEKISPWLRADFNLENAAAAAVVALAYGVSAQQVLVGLSEFSGVAGRLEILEGTDGKRVVIDAALTPESLEALYQYLATHYSLLATSSAKSRLICVFGSAGGGRDTWKRPKLGEIADKYCAKILLTNDDPYTESQQGIVEEIAAGIKDKSKVEIILDRNRAINRAINRANPGDVVAITGMGSQTYQYIGKQKLPWSDREAVQRSLL